MQPEHHFNAKKYLVGFIAFAIGIGVMCFLAWVIEDLMGPTASGFFYILAAIAGLFMAISVWRLLY